jgi:hypothetical protein
MPRRGEARLAVLQRRLPDRSPEACLARALWRLKAELREPIYHAAVRAAGIHPVMIGALRVCAEAADKLRALSDTPELARADEAVLRALPGSGEDSGSCDDLEAKLAEIAARYAEGGDPGALGSVLEWWGWTLAHPEPDPPEAVA